VVTREKDPETENEMTLSKFLHGFIPKSDSLAISIGPEELLLIAFPGRSRAFGVDIMAVKGSSIALSFEGHDGKRDTHDLEVGFASVFYPELVERIAITVNETVTFEMDNAVFAVETESNDPPVTETSSGNDAETQDGAPSSIEDARDESQQVDPVVSSDGMRLDMQKL